MKWIYPWASAYLRDSSQRTPAPFISITLSALIGLVLSPLAVAHASSPSADHVQKCAPFDYEQWRSDHPRPAGKRLAALDVGEPRTVRMIYFLPNDQRYRAAAVDTMKIRMRQAQDFFAREMEARGYGNTIVRFEADAQGEPLVHRVDGKHSTRHYNDKYTVDKVLEEVVPVFDLEANVYYIAIDNGNYTIYRGDRLVGGVGSRWGKKGGYGMVSIGVDFGIIAHELGHAFGLSHDFRDDTYVMSYGYIPDWLSANQRLSACNAEFLAVHTYFNPNSPIEDGSRPTIEESTSSPIHISAGTTSIPVRIKGRDPDGLHQAILFTQTQAPHSAEGYFEVKACRGLEGRTTPVVEFDYDGVAPSRPGSDFNTFETQGLSIQVVDALGNTGWSDFLELINPEFDKPISTFPISSWPKFFVSMVFSSDGRLLALEASYEDDKVTLRDVSTGKSIATLPPWGPRDWALSPDDRLLALEAPNGTIVLWDVASGKQHVATAPAHQKDQEIPDGLASSSLAFSPDGKLLATGGRHDYLVKLWDVASGEHAATFPALRYGGSITSLAFSPDGKRLAAYNSGGTVRLWDVASREHVATIDAHEDGAWSNNNEVAFSPDGRLLATGGTRWTSEVEGTSEVKLWNVSTGKPISATLFGSDPVAFSPDGRLLATGSGIETKVFDLDGLEGGTSQGEHYGGNAVRLWEVSTGEPIAILPPFSHINDLAFSPDGKRLVEMVYEVVRLWDTSEWTPTPHTLTRSSGDGQQGRAGATLAEPFVVSVLDQYGSALAGTVVSFSVTTGGGTLSSTTATTDANGRARSTLTLGSELGTNTVAATVAGLAAVTFTATAVDQTPHSLTKVSGDGQRGPASTQLATLLVVSVLDQDGSPLAGVPVSFSVTAGGGILSSTTDSNPCTVVSSMSSTTTTTDANGQAAVRLTLGSDAGTNTVAATVEDLEPVTFTATAAEQAMPHRLTKVCGDDQEGTVGAPLTVPLVVSVQDEDGAAMAGVIVSFAVTAGGGTLSSATATTDANGRAATRLTLGSEPGTNMVSATVEGLESVSFTATGQEDPLLSLFDIFLGGGKLVALPESTQLLQNAPNPFNSETVVSYFLLEPGLTRLEVFTLTGQLVAVLHQGPQQAGYHRLHWDGRDAAGRSVSSGIYLYRLVTSEDVLTRKLVLLR